MTRRPTVPNALSLLLCLLATAAAAREPGGVTSSGPRQPGSVTRTFYLENADVKDVLTILRSVAGIAQVAADESLAAIDVRDSPEAVELAQRLVEAHDRRRAEVRVDVELFELDREKLHAAGRELGGGEGGGRLPSRLSPSQLERLVAAGEGRLVAHPALSVTAGGKAEVMIGERVPVAVDGDGTRSYQEVGFRLEVRPRVHPGAGEVTLDFHLEISRRASGGTSPIIATRRVTSSVRLADGATYFLAGLGNPGKEDPVATTEVGLALTPRIDPGS